MVKSLSKPYEPFMTYGVYGLPGTDSETQAVRLHDPLCGLKYPLRGDFACIEVSPRRLRELYV